MDEKILILSKYNFWNRNVPETGFPRRDYTDKIMDYLNTKLVKVLVGQRRVGKSYILRQIASQLISNGISQENIFYINKEFTGLDFISSYKDLGRLVKFYRKQLRSEGKVWLFVD